LSKISWGDVFEDIEDELVDIDDKLRPSKLYRRQRGEEHKP
jgi:hypothetical protein